MWLGNVDEISMLLEARDGRMVQSMCVCVRVFVFLGWIYNSFGGSRRASEKMKGNMDRALSKGRNRMRKKTEKKRSFNHSQFHISPAWRVDDSFLGTKFGRKIELPRSHTLQLVPLNDGDNGKENESRLKVTTCRLQSRKLFIFIYFHLEILLISPRLHNKFTFLRRRFFSFSHVLLAPSLLSTTITRDLPSTKKNLFSSPFLWFRMEERTTTTTTKKPAE